MPNDPNNPPAGVSPISGTAPPAEHRWKPGHSGNPSGAPAGQVYPGRWLGPLAEATDDELRQIVADESASRSKRMAAQLLLDTADSDPNVRRRAFAEILDRTEGKPHQTRTVEHKRNDTPEQLLAEVRQLAGVEVPRAKSLPNGSTPQSE